jgi:hypothetical protein
MLKTRWLFVVLALIVIGQSHLDAQAVPFEYRLKAAFVYQFPQFVQWPSAAWRNAHAVQLCILEPNPFGSELEQLVRDQSLNGLPLLVKEIFGSDELAGCHVVFVGARSGDASSVLKATAGRPVLTVGEADHFLDSGGIIAMKTLDGKVRFEIHADNARKAGLRISSQLLSLALAVRGGPP